MLRALFQIEGGGDGDEIVIFVAVIPHHRQSAEQIKNTPRQFSRFYCPGIVCIIIGAVDSQLEVENIGSSGNGYNDGDMP